MVNNKKIIKEKNISVREKIVGLASVLLTAFVGLKGGVGATLTVVAVCCCGCRILRLFLRVLGLFFSVVLVVILIVIISLVTF